MPYQIELDSAAAQGIGRTHVVRPGENLFRIALRYGVSVQAIATINGIVNPAMIYVGQPLVIPADADTSVPATPNANASASPTPTLAPATPEATSAPITPTLTLSPTVAATLVPSQTVTPAPVMTPVVPHAA